MKRGALIFAVALGAGVLSSSPAMAALDPETAAADTQATIESSGYSFCTRPDDPLSARARELCPLAEQMPGCTALATLCHKPTEEPAKLNAFWERVMGTLGQVVPYIAWVCIAALLGVVVYLVLRALRASRDEALPDAPVTSSDVTLLPADAVPPRGAEASWLLRRAMEARRQGDARTALLTYLAASLRALDDRGAVRLSRERTHGEYVRSCRDAAARPGLRDIVREVDAVQFGGRAATDEAAALAESRAERIVHAPQAASLSPLTVLMLSLALLLSSCKGVNLGIHGDPAGHELLVELLKKQGAAIATLPGSLASLPMRGASGPALILDAERVPLEDETRAHLLAWVKQGGVLVITGDPGRWPADLWARPLASTPGDAADDEASETVAVRVETRPEARGMRARPDVHHAVLPRRVAMTWPHEDSAPRAVARFDDGELYGALRELGDGRVLGLASDDLFTNLGLAAPGNAESLIALLGTLGRNEFAIARAEQGITPPSNPFAGLVRIGLGPALIHVALFLPLLFFAYGVRQSAPRAEPPPHRRAFAEHIQAVGALYAKRREARHALAVYARHVDDRLRAAMGRDRDPAQFLASRSGADGRVTAALYHRAVTARARDGAVRGDELEDLQQLSSLYRKAVRRE